MANLLTVSDEAKQWLAQAMSTETRPVCGIKVTVNQKGCAGGEYEFVPVYENDVMAECDKVTDNGVTVYFPRVQLLKLIGAELILHRDKLNTRLDFRNPNESSRCGCGESVSFKVQ